MRHNLDMMHVERNIYNSFIKTLLNIPRKTKDRVKARLDLVDMTIRLGLALEKRGKCLYLPLAYHRLSRKEKKKILSVCMVL